MRTRQQISLLNPSLVLFSLLFFTLHFLKAGGEVGREGEGQEGEGGEGERVTLLSCCFRSSPFLVFDLACLNLWNPDASRSWPLLTVAQDAFVSIFNVCASIVAGLHLSLLIQPPPDSPPPSLPAFLPVFIFIFFSLRTLVYCDFFLLFSFDFFISSCDSRALGGMVDLWRHFRLFFMLITIDYLSRNHLFNE